LHDIDENKITFAVSLIDSIVTGAEISILFKKEYPNNHVYYLGVVAATIYKNGLNFTYISYTQPFLISQYDLEHTLENQKSDICSLINNGIDPYHHFSNGAVSCEDMFSAAITRCLRRLNNVRVYGFDTPKEKVDTVITFGTFDLFHELHQRLLRHSLPIAKQLVVYVYNKDNKKKEESYVSLSDSVSERISNVATYALNASEANIRSHVIVRRMTRKHIPELKRAIKEYSSDGSLAIWGGEDQYSHFYDILDVCFRLKVPIIAINRGDEDKALCSSDIRNKQSYQRIADSYGVDIQNVSALFWKTQIKNSRLAKDYLAALPYFGHNGAGEIWKYDSSFFLDKKITKPISSTHKMIICLPGRTPCEFDRARKILLTLKNKLPSNTENLDYYLLGYKEDGKATEYHITRLEKRPWSYFSDDAMLVVKNLFMSRVSKDIKIEKQEAKWSIQVNPNFKKKSVSELESTFSEITLSGRSRGSVISLEIENAFLFCMQSLGYQDEEIILISKHVTVLNVSNIASLERNRLFSTFTVTGINDKKANKSIHLFSEKFAKLNHDGYSCTLKRMSQTHHCLFAKIPEEIFTGKDNYGRINPSFKISDKDCHYTPLFISRRVNGDNTLPNLLNKVFNNMVAREPDFDFKKFA